MAKEKVRILYCIETLESGGVERRRLTLVDFLDSTQYEIVIICTRISGPFVEYFHAKGIRIVEVGRLTSSFKWSVHKNVRRVIREFKPHIIHGAVFEGVTMAALNGFWCGVPVRLIEETSDPQTRSKKASFLLKFLAILAHKIVAISPSVRDYLIEEAGIPQHKVRLINNGVNIPRLVEKPEVEDVKNTYGITAKYFVVGSAGRIRDDQKAFSDLIKAMDLIRESHADVRLMIVGEGPDRQLLTDMANGMGLDDRVIWPGYQNDMAPFYETMDTFAIVSNREGFGLVAAEAMLHGLPVIATKVGGLNTIVVDQKTGFLVDRKSPDQIAEAIKGLYNDDRLVESMGKQGYERALKEFSAEVYVKKVEALYKELLKIKKII